MRRAVSFVAWVHLCVCRKLVGGEPVGGATVAARRAEDARAPRRGGRRADGLNVWARPKLPAGRTYRRTVSALGRRLPAGPTSVRRKLGWWSAGDRVGAAAGIGAAPARSFGANQHGADGAGAPLPVGPDRDLVPAGGQRLARLRRNPPFHLELAGRIALMPERVRERARHH